MKVLQTFIGAGSRQTFLTVVTVFSATACDRQTNASLESYRALANRATVEATQQNLGLEKSIPTRDVTAKLAAASLILSREDLIPCASLPPRKLTIDNERVIWLDGSWSNYARPFIVKGSVQSDQCRLELHPTGKFNLHLGARDAFVRGDQIRFLLANTNGDALYTPANQGHVSCIQKNSVFEVAYDGNVLGQSPISYVMNESIPLELTPHVCLARVLDESKKALPEWVFVILSLPEKKNSN